MDGQFPLKIGLVRKERREKVREREKERKGRAKNKIRESETKR